MLFFGNRPKAEQFDAFPRVDALAEVIRRHIPTYAGRTAIRYDDGMAYRAISFADYSRALAALIPYFSAKGASRGPTVARVWLVQNSRTPSACSCLKPASISRSL